MGEDGAKRVVVNSVGREIRTLEKIEPTEGKRLQLTIDADVQRSIEDGFRAFGFNGAAVLLDPANGDVLAFTSLPAYDPNAFAAGIDRATWVGAQQAIALRPLNDRALQGRYSPGSTFKMAVAAAALEEGVITPDFQVHCRGAGVFYGRAFKCWKAGGHGTIDLRHAIEAVVQRLLLHDRQHGRGRQDPQVGDAARTRRQERHRPAERDRRHRAVDGMEAAAHRREVVRGRNDLGRDRSGTGVGDADLDGGL